MSGKPPADFLAVVEKMTTPQLERSLEGMREKAESGDRIAQDIVAWTTQVLDERARTENQPTLGADGHMYTQREYREKRDRDDAQAGLNALTGNFASALVYKLTGDANLAGLAGGLFSAVGGTAKGYNERRQITPPDQAPATQQGGSPPRESEPPSTPETSGDGAGTGAATPAGLKTGGLDLEWITYADVVAFAEAVFALPDSVVEAARDLASAGTPPSEATMDFLAQFAATETAYVPPAAEQDGDSGEETGTDDGEAEEPNQEEEAVELAYLGDSEHEQELDYLDEGDGAALSYLDDGLESEADQTSDTEGSDEGDSGGAEGAVVTGTT